MNRFLNKHQDNIVGSLSCFDRVIFKGYLPITHEKGCEGLFYDQHWLIERFKYKATLLAGNVQGRFKAGAKSSCIWREL